MIEFKSLFKSILDFLRAIHTRISDFFRLTISCLNNNLFAIWLQIHILNMSSTSKEIYVVSLVQTKVKIQAWNQENWIANKACSCSSEYRRYEGTI